MCVFWKLKSARGFAARGANLGRCAEMLMERFAGEVNPHVCEQPGENLGTSRRKMPTHLMLRWRGADAPTVQDFVGHDVTFAYVLSEHMMGLREGDTIVLYALHWSYGWGHA